MMTSEELRQDLIRKGIINPNRLPTVDLECKQCHVLFTRLVKHSHVICGNCEYSHEKPPVKKLRKKRVSTKQNLPS